MSTAEEEKHLRFIDHYLIGKIIVKLKTETLVKYEAEHSGGLDGFMSALYTIKLTTNTVAEQRTERLLIVKFMKGDTTFRETSKSYPQFANEVFIYNDVIPTFAKLLKAAKVDSPSVDDWVAPSYMAKFGYIEGLSSSPNELESVLVLENVKSLGYKIAPGDFLDKGHLLTTTRVLGQYHALSYALRLCDETEFERLKSKIIPLPFINDDDANDAKHNLYRIIHRIGFDRLYDYFDKRVSTAFLVNKNEDDSKLIERMSHLREKYFTEPTRLLERLRTKADESEKDRRFTAILHGDLHRNNLLFRYGSNQSEEYEFGEVRDVKIIDFQELRYGSCAIDLSFFMYMNIQHSIRSEVWMEILKEYHDSMYGTLSKILKGSSKMEKDFKKIEKCLQKYSFQNFSSHFSRFAVFGVVICISFLSWLLCDDTERSIIWSCFETDIHGEDFRKISMTAGGEEVNLAIWEILRHACKMGYLDQI